MVNYTSVASGAWNNTAVWSPAAKPVAGDNVTIAPGTMVYWSYNEACANMTINSGGTLRVLGAPGNNILTVSSVLTVNSGGIIDSYNASATLKATINCDKLILTTPVSPSNDFAYIRFRYIKPMLGSVVFNDTDPATSPRILSVTPLARTPRLIEHDIDGRNASRIYRRGTAAGRLAVTGYFRNDAFSQELLEAMHASASPYPFVSEFAVLRACRIDGKISYQSVPGGLYTRFSFNLVEAI